MEQDNRAPERKQLTEALIQQVDSVADSPSVRASFLWNVLRENTNATDWDVICFAVEALGMLSSKYTWLREAAKVSARLVYHAHYLYPGNFNARVGSEFDFISQNSRRSEP